VKAPRSDWLGFTAMCVGMFMAILDIQVVAAALPRISQALSIPLDRLSWIQTAYLITEVIAIALSGRLTRALSTRGVFTLGVAGFVVASLGCAFSQSFVPLIAWRAMQGFCGGVIIPTAFAAGYKMFPRPLQPRAILIAGAMAMLAPSLGPFLGGYIAQKLVWNWLFLINVPIGIVVAAVVAARIRIDDAEPSAWRTIDVTALVALAAGLALLLTLLKIAPGDHWVAARDLYLSAGTLLAGAVFVRRCIGTSEALVDFSPLRAGSFSAACVFNFVLGLGLYGSVYLLPLFLGFVRYHSPYQIGLIMTVTGLAQLMASPLATLAEKRFPAMAVTAFGFGLFGLGSFANAFATPRSDFSELFWPQVLRGVAVLFCILPITNVALEKQPAAELANASGLLNLMRNIGGAVGIGLVDTIVNVRPPAIASQIVSGLTHGSRRIADFVGVPVDLFAGQTMASIDPSDLVVVRPIIERAAATVAFNEAWILLGALMALSLLVLPLLRRGDASSVANDAEGFS
jgi:MFS transporter, DHA2 family, multidrug resistance protein